MKPSTKDFLFKFCITLCVIGVLFGAYNLYTFLKGNQETKTEYEDLAKQVSVNITEEDVEEEEGGHQQEAHHTGVSDEGKGKRPCRHLA